MAYSHTANYVGLERSNDFEPGDIAVFTYRDADGEYTARELLVLGVDDDPDFEADLVHGIDLTYLSTGDLVFVAEKFSEIGSYQSDFEDAIEGEDPRVLLDEAEESTTEQWYKHRFDPEAFEGNPYRTFRIDRMSGEKIVTGYDPTV